MYIDFRIAYLNFECNAEDRIRIDTTDRRSGNETQTNAYYLLFIFISIYFMLVINGIYFTKNLIIILTTSRDGEGGLDHVDKKKIHMIR